MSTPRSTPDPQTADPSAPKIGRRLGIAIFWLLAAYVIGMSSISVISALYWPDSAPHPSGAGVGLCATEIRELEQELVSHTTDYLGRRDIRGMEAWLQQWDRRFLALAGCGALEPARRELGELRTEMERLLERYGRDAARRQERILQALEQLPTRRAELSRKEQK
ncbi:MAG: hypothetical protein OXT09_16820 [Myxococcales bacterium]|nr:hypothetical protein [Myxococcales bacterium]